MDGWHFPESPNGLEKDSLGCIIGLFIIILILALIDKT